jgi:hypothetical protein
MRLTTAAMNAYYWRDAEALQRVVRQVEERTETLFAALAHGDEIHRAWLKEAIEAHFAGKPVTPWSYPKP